MTAAEREKKKTAQEYISTGFPKKKMFWKFHILQGEFVFFWAGKKTLNLQKKRQHSICKKTFMTKFAVNVEKSCGGEKKKKGLIYF